MGNIISTGQSNLPIPQNTTVLTTDMLNDIRDDRNIKHLIIPHSVFWIYHFAFEGCSSLESITIPDSVTKIEQGAFSYCSSLTSIDIPDTVTRIEAHTFKGCKSLTSINIPDSVTEIRYRAFEGCKSLTSINIPDSVTEIRFRAFEGCTALTTTTIPDSISKIRYDVFKGCSNLSSITIPNSVTNIEEGAFDGCTSLTSITIPDSVTAIGPCAFKGCSSLNHLIIPDSLIDKSTSYWAHTGIDLNKTKLITHSQLSKWAERHKLKEKSIEKLSTLYQLQKDDDYQPSWSELGKRSRHIIIGDLLTILPNNKRNVVLPQVLISQHGNKEKHSTKEEQLLHTLSLLNRAPAENLDQEKVSSHDNTSIDTKENQTKENSKDNSLSLGASLASKLTLADTAKLLMYCTENTGKLKAANAKEKEPTTSSSRIEPLDTQKDTTKNPRQRLPK